MAMSRVIHCLLLCLLLAGCSDAVREDRKQQRRFGEAAELTFPNVKVPDDPKDNFGASFRGEKGRYFAFYVYRGMPDRKLDATPFSTIMAAKGVVDGDTTVDINVRWTDDPGDVNPPRLVMTAMIPDPDITYHAFFVYTHSSTELEDDERGDIEAEMIRHMTDFMRTMREKSLKRAEGKQAKAALNGKVSEEEGPEP